MGSKRGRGGKDNVMGRQIASVIILEHATLNLKERYIVEQEYVYAK